MKKLLGGLLMAATILTPIAPAAAQDRNSRDHRYSEQRRDYERREAEQRRQIEQRRQAEQRRAAEQRRGSSEWQIDRRTPEQRRADIRRQEQRNHQNWRDNDRRDPSRRDWDRRDNRDNRNWNNNQSHNREWNRGWRNDRRYDYRNYRSSNRNIYRMPRYQAPYNGHRYSRFSVGSRVNNGFYNQRYWISNPSRYRLPPAYGNYRWVRYYDDAVLVDTRRGNVVDVLYDFFW